MKKIPPPGAAKLRNHHRKNMMNDPGYELLAAFSVGFMASLHCVAMCGGISFALTTAVSPKKEPSLLRPLAYQLLFNTGRLFSYAVAGALVGGLGSLLYDGLNLTGPSYLRVFAGAMMILLGLYISGWWKILSQLERIGAQLWKRISPLTRALTPVDAPHKAVILGALWGWVPCGLVYSALAWSLGSGDPFRGALLMLCFGVGTLPTLLAFGSFGHWLNSMAQNPIVRSFAALSLLAYGIWTIYGQFQG